MELQLIFLYKIINKEIMSLIQFLQQTLLKNVNHQTLQLIQNEHSANESLLDMLSSLRSLNKLQIIEKKLQSAKLYAQIKQDLFRSLNGLDSQIIQRWTGTIFKSNNLIAQLIKSERSQIENMIIQTIKQIFVFEGSKTNQQEYERKILNMYIYSLTQLKQMEQTKQKIDRKFIIKISQLDEKFTQFKSQFQYKVQKFNLQLQYYVKNIKAYEENIKKQFKELLNKKENVNNTPFKSIENKLLQNEYYEYDYNYNPSQKQVSNFYQTQFGFRDRDQNQIPTRDYLSTL